MERREKFDLGDFDISTVAVIHRWGADVFRTRRRWPYMQHGTGIYPHLGTVRDNTNALASTGTGQTRIGYRTPGSLPLTLPSLNYRD